MAGVWKGALATILRDYAIPAAAKRHGGRGLFHAGAWQVSSFARRLVRAGSSGLSTGHVQRDAFNSAADTGLMEELAKEYTVTLPGSDVWA